MPTPWENFKPTRKRKTKLRSSTASVPPSTTAFPANLCNITTLYVTRASTSKTASQEELLDLDLEYDDTQFIRFDVFVNEDYDVNTVELDRVEYAGSFSNLAHVHKPHITTSSTTKTTFSLAISELLQDSGLQDDDKILVCLVPRAGGCYLNVNNASTQIVDC